ncbi:MAG: hypothetical protein WD877_01075 [Candidatus Saccharimonadales bacterium]
MRGFKKALDWARPALNPEVTREGIPLFEASRFRAGYTFIEALIVLAISTSFFLGAMVLVNGQQSKTGFSGAMRDLESRVRNYVSQVTSGTFPDSAGYSCEVNATGHPVLSPAAGGIGESSECLFLGRAIQAVPSHDHLYIYPVIGTKNAYNGANNLGTAATGFNQINTSPAVSSGGQFLLVDEYKLLDGASVLKTSVAGSSGDFSLAGFYTALSSDGGSASNSLLAKAYPLISTTDTIKSAALKSCLEKNPPCAELSDFSRWDLCVQSGDGNQTAILSINNTAAGITTKLSFEVCS